jgi:hypothetical protein
MGKCVRNPEFVLMSHGVIGVKALETSSQWLSSSGRLLLPLSSFVIPSFCVDNSEYEVRIKRIQKIEKPKKSDYIADFMLRFL